MWIMTPRGFYSAVEKFEDRLDGLVTVRARSREDLDNLKDLLPQAKPYKEEYRFSDYPWRIRVGREEWGSAVEQMAREIDYDNFKDRVKVQQGAERAAIYGSVWAKLLDIEPYRTWINRQPSYPATYTPTSTKGKGKAKGKRKGKAKQKRSRDDMLMSYDEAVEIVERDFVCDVCDMPVPVWGGRPCNGDRCECGGCLYELPHPFDDPFVAEMDPEQERLNGWLASHPAAETG